MSASDDLRRVQQMIKVRVRDEDGINTRANMFQTFGNAIGLGLNTLIERGRQKSDAAKVRID